MLPPNGESADAETARLLRDFLGFATNLPEPTWLKELVVPDQSAIEQEIGSKRESLKQIENQLIDAEKRLSSCKRWCRLLYDDGESLETIVKESFELLGASVAKRSKEKDDYRLKVDGYPETVMEVKGTHNPKFSKGALRQLAGWIDEANATENIVVKGLFVGNAGRNDPPQSRAELFEPNNEKYAVIRDIVVLRSMDLYCLTILKRLGLLDVAAMWKELYSCKGSFGATSYWKALPQEFHLPKPS